MLRKNYTYLISYIFSLFIILLGGQFSICLAQTSDSLITILKNSPKDSNRVILLNDIAWELKVESPDSARIYLQQASDLAKKYDFPKGEAQAYNNWGVVETIHGNYPLAIAYYQKALTFRQQLADEKGVASLLNNIGNLELEQEAYISALDYFKRSLNIREVLQDTFRMARVHYNISNTHEQMGNYLEALDHVYTYLSIMEELGKKAEIATAYNMIGNIKTELEEFEDAYIAYNKALAIRQESDDQWGLIIIYNNIGNSFDDRGESNLRKDKPARALPQFYQAISYHEKSLNLRKKLGDEDGEYASYNNMGLVYKNLGTYYLQINDLEDADNHFTTALGYFNQSLEYRKKRNDQRGMMEIYNGIGDVKRRQGKYEEALHWAEQYYQIAQALNDQKFIQIAYKDISRAYDGLGDYQQAYIYRKQYDELRYSRLDEARVKQNQRLEIIYGDRRKEQQIRAQQHELALQEAALQKAELRQNALTGGALGLLLLLGLVLFAYRLKANTTKQLSEKNAIIQSERERSDELLLNILPAETAQELKNKGKASTKRYSSVTVLFTDFQAFTQLTEKMDAEELVAELDRCFSAFDGICAKYNVEKIKTIGDAYMCVGGLPKENSNHPQDVLKVAFEVRDFMRNYKIQRKKEGKPYFEIRLGMHTGPVIAGIVGKRKFAYDIWGNTVNTAARLESAGIIDKINISKTTYQELKNDYHCTYRGAIDAKNMGKIDMYFVEETLPRPSIGERYRLA